MSTTLSLDQTVRQAKGNLVSDMNGEKVMMSINSGKYYNLGQVGGRIWELIENPVEVGQVVTQLLSEYEVEQGACEAQVLGFLNMLSREGLIETGVTIP